MKRSEINKKARKEIAKIAEGKNLTRCELNFPGCLQTFGIAPAHKHSRIHYKTWQELSDFSEWVVACQRCHQTLDDRSKTTKEENDNIFKRLR